MAIDIQTQNRLDIQLEQVINQFLAANPGTIAKGLLDDIVREQIRAQNLETLTLIGRKGPNIMARAVLRVFYSNGQANVRVDPYLLPPDVDHSLWDQDATSGSAESDSKRGVSPVWQEGLRLFRQMIDQRGYELIWSPSFIRDEEQMLRRYGLVRVSLCDRTVGGSEHQIDHEINPLMSLQYHLNDHAFSPRSKS